MRLIFSLFALLIVVCAFAVDGVAGPYKVSLRTEPVVVPVGKAKVTVVVTDKQGKPVSDASVKVFARMPGMNMGEREETAVATDTKGTYTASAAFAMAGQYDVTVSVSSPAGNGQVVLGLTTGQSSAGAPNNNSTWFVVLGVAAVVGLVLWRMRSTGQSASWKGVFSRTVVVSLIVLGASLAIGVWAVRNLRREGAMTPLEAQVMEMNTPAPEGDLPVVLAEAKEEPFSESISYAGQVVGYVEQDVVPRVSGTIVEMPVYVGDKVKRGQLLARLDTSQIDPMVAEKSAGVTSASQGVNVADSEYRQAATMVEQAEAEVQMASTEVGEAKSGLDAAKAAKVTAASGVGAADAERRSAQADLDAAKADQAYQSQEFERMRQLYDKRVVSKDEWQAAVAAKQRSDAAVASANARLAKAGSMLTGARSDVTRADAEVAAATTRVSRAEANLKAKQAQVKSARAGVQTAQAKVGQSHSSVAEASASLRSMTTQRGYAELRAEVDGVVTQRVISPGVLVAPGQSVLKVAQVSPVRIQANVAQVDLAKVKVGDMVHVQPARQGQVPLMVQVTSVAPSVDPSSRTGVVEALYDNLDHRFNPGQFVSVEIRVGSESNALVVPSEAVSTETRNGKSVTKVWVAAAGAPGRLTVTEREVQVAGRSAAKTAVISGLKAGERVVVSPFGLAEGMAVRSVEQPTKATGDTMTIELNSAGYAPESVEIPAGKPVKLVFIRRVADTCGTSVKFPDLGIETETPLNKPVTIDIPPQQAGKRLTFTCPMDMYKGTAVAK